MPTSAVTILGYPAKTEKADELLRQLGVDPACFYASYREDDHDIQLTGPQIRDGLNGKAVKGKLAAAYAAAMGNIDPDCKSGRASFCLEMAGDPVETRDRWPEDFIVGVPLDSRYKPTWLDLDRPHGTDGALLLDDPQTDERIEQARAALAEQAPAFKDAQIFHKLVWY